MVTSPGKMTDLGKPTMRGIRKCPKCGTFNGTRGLSCKNKSCDMVFKESDGRGKRCDAVKLYTVDRSNIFSVRLREKGPDYRSFVHLATSDIIGHGEAIDCSQSRCHVDTCQKSVSGSEDLVLCSHISACVGPHVVEATPVMLRTSALNDLNIR